MITGVKCAEQVGCYVLSYLRLFFLVQLFHGCDTFMIKKSVKELPAADQSWCTVHISIIHPVDCTSIGFHWKMVFLNPTNVLSVTLCNRLNSELKVRTFPLLILTWF